MTTEELKARCQALASVGDTQAIATLDLFKKYETECKNFTKAIDSLLKQIEEKVADVEKATKQIEPKFSNAQYVLNSIRFSIELAESLNLLPAKGGEKVKAEGVVIDPQHLGETFFSGKIKSGSDALGLQISPEEMAAAATRLANGLPPQSEPAVTAVSASGAAGAYDKTPKMDQKTGE